MRGSARGLVLISGILGPTRGLESFRRGFGGTGCGSLIRDAWNVGKNMLKIGEKLPQRSRGQQERLHPKRQRRFSFGHPGRRGPRFTAVGVSRKTLFRMLAEILGNHPELMELPDDEREMWIDLLW
jgi:hypothetical protein